MAARTALPSKEQQERTRAAIKTSQLINRLQDFALGAKDPKTDEPIVVDANRLKAIEVLLRKSLPDLSAVTLSGDAENPLVIHVNIGGDDDS
jgi:hypothetical protein